MEQWNERLVPATLIAEAGNEMPLEALREHVIMAFNLPPSQYQLHLQYMSRTQVVESLSMDWQPL